MVATVQEPLSSARFDWAGIIDSDEDVLWQGRPDPGLYFRLKDFFSVVGGFFFAGCAVLWMILGGFLMIGLLLFGIGIAAMVGDPIHSCFKRQRSWYALTTRRAMIARETLLYGKLIESYSITAATPISIEEKGELTSIHFASRTVHYDGVRNLLPIGFEYIRDGRTVLALMRQIQRRPS
jgi:hypothetical protein